MDSLLFGFGQPDRDFSHCAKFNERDSRSSSLKSRKDERNLVCVERESCQPLGIGAGDAVALFLPVVGSLFSLKNQRL